MVVKVRNLIRKAGSSILDLTVPETVKKIILESDEVTDRLAEAITAENGKDEKLKKTFDQRVREIVREELKKSSS